MNKTLLLMVSLLLIAVSTFAQKPVASFTISGQCQGQVITYTSTSTTAIGTIVSNRWYFGTTDFSDTATGDVVSFTYDDDTNYWVQLITKNSLGLSDTHSTNVKIYPTPIGIIEANIPCFPATIDLTDASTLSTGIIGTRVWDVSGFSSFSPTFNLNPVRGDYTANLTVTSNKGCIGKATMTFTYGDIPLIVMDPISPISICEGTSIKITASGAKSYIWDIGDTTESIVASTAGFHFLTGYTSNKCFARDSVQVVVNLKPTADAGTDVTIGLGERTTLEGSGGVYFFWSPAGSLTDPRIANPEASPDSTTTYILTVTDDNGCTGRDSVTVSVNASASYPVHNMLTPNGDGYNDVWDLSNIPEINTASIHVFNRWGWEVFKSDDYTNNWQGDYKNEPLPDGSYLYVIKFKNSSRETLKGNLEIIRNIQK